MSVARFASLSKMFVGFGCFEQIDVVSTRFRYVNVRAFGVF